MPETPRGEQGKKPTQGGLGNIDEERGDPGRSAPGTGIKDKDNPVRPDNERQTPGTEKQRG